MGSAFVPVAGKKSGTAVSEMGDGGSEKERSWPYFLPGFRCVPFVGVSGCEVFVCGVLFLNKD